MELGAFPGCLAVRSELQAPAHQLPLSVSGPLNLPQLFHAVHEGLDQKSRQGYALVYGKMFGLAQDVLRKGKGDVLFVHVFTCNTQTGALSIERKQGAAENETEAMAAWSSVLAEAPDGPLAAEIRARIDQLVN